MHIRHERPMSDLSFQVRAPLKLTLSDGRIVAIDKWSLSSIQFPEDTDILPKAGTLAIPFQGVEIQFPVRFEEGQGQGELLFKDLTGRERETLAVFYRSILSGKMAGTDDVITSLDTPVDLVPMGETEAEVVAGSAGKSPRLLRAIWNIGLYSLVAILVFGLVGGQIWNRLSHVPLDHARVVSPLIELHSPEAAYVDRIMVEVGEKVRQGQVLVRLSNPERDARIAETRADVVKADANVRDARQIYLRHMTWEEDERAILEQAYQDIVNQNRWNDLPEFHDEAAEADALRSLELFDAGKSEKPGDFHDTRKVLRAVLDDQKAELARIKRELGLQKGADEAADIVATANGTISQIDVFRDQFIARGSPVISFEENTPRAVRAWMNEARATAIHVGMPTTIRFNEGSGTRSIKGTVTDIVAGIDPTISDEFGIIVTTSFDDLNTTKSRQMFRTDAPVELRAVKPWAFTLPWAK